MIDRPDSSTAGPPALRPAARGGAETPRTYGAIVRENLFTFVNVVIFTLCVSLAILGEVGDALISAVVVGVNVLLGVIQEIRAKRILDRVALLTRPQAQVLRNGTVATVDPGDLVIGDVLVIGPGDQVVADGRVVDAHGLRIDEGLLTGESSSVAKGAGAEIHAGSFCVVGSGTYRAERIGDAALAGQITLGAQSFRRVTTPLQRELNVVLRVAMLVALSFALVLVTSAVFNEIPLVDTMRRATVVAGLIPNGLFLAIAAAYALSAVRIARRGVLVQQANSVESLSHVTILCLDKTGTLTTGKLVVDDLTPISARLSELRQALERYAVNVHAPNRTVAAIAAAYPGGGMAGGTEVPFSAERRWSAVQFRDGSGTFVLGAPEILLAETPPVVAAAIAAAAAKGLRVLLLAHASTPVVDREPDPPILPSPLEPLGLVTLRDELRPAAHEALDGFARSGVRVKVISGDHPETLRSIATAAGIATDAEIALGTDLEAIADRDLGPLVVQRDLFARVGPREKARIVRALRADGEYVAMIGDGINDVLALKAADLAIALRGGAEAARAVADLVLLDDSFAALPAVVREGRRIVTAMHSILRLFLTRVVYAAVLIGAVAMIGSGFPFTPRQNAVLSLIAVGLPSFALAAWSAPRGGARAVPSAASLLRFVLPAGWSIAMLGFVLYAAVIGGGAAMGVARDAAELAAQSALVHLCVWSGLLLFAFGPVAGGPGGRAAPQWRVVAVAIGLGLAFGYASALPGLASLFDLAPVAPLGSLLLLGVAVLWLLGLRRLQRSFPEARSVPVAATT